MCIVRRLRYIISKSSVRGVLGGERIFRDEGVGRIVTAGRRHRGLPRGVGGIVVAIPVFEISGKSCKDAKAFSYSPQSCTSSHSQRSEARSVLFQFWLLSFASEEETHDLRYFSLA